MEKTIVSKMGLFGILAIFIPGGLSLWVIEIMCPILQELDIYYIASVNMRGVIFAFFAFIIGVIVNVLMDQLWKIPCIGHRNDKQIILGCLYKVQACYETPTLDRLFEGRANILRNYDIAYEFVQQTYQHNSISSIEAQAAMLRNLIFPELLLIPFILNKDLLFTLLNKIGLFAESMNVAQLCVFYAGL